MKSKFIFYGAVLILASGVVLSQNYTNPTTNTDTEPLSLQKISYQMINQTAALLAISNNTAGGINVSNLSVSLSTNVDARITGGTSYVDVLTMPEISFSVSTNVDARIVGGTNYVNLLSFTGLTDTQLRASAIQVTPIATSKIVTVTPQTAASAMADTYSLVNLFAIDCGRASATPVWLTAITAIDVDDISSTKPQFDLYLFNQAVTLPAIGAAWNVTDADMLNCVGGPFPIGSANAWTSLGTLNGTAFIPSINQLMAPASGTTLYGAIRARSTFTPGSTNSFKFRFTFIQE